MRTTISCLLLSFLSIAPAACSDSDGRNNGGDGVTGTAKGIYRPSTGEVIVSNTTEWLSIEALVGEGAAQKSYPGTIDADGNLTIPGVPVGPYQLVLTSKAQAGIPGAKPFKTVIVTDARTLDLDRIYSYRPDLKEMTKPTFLTLDATLNMPWQRYEVDGMGGVIQSNDDNLDFMSQNASIAGSWASFGSLGNGDTQISGWMEDVQQGLWFGVGNFARPLIDGSKGDELTILHQVAHTVGMADPNGDPWKGYQYRSTEETLQAPSFTMTDGGTSSVSGAFKATPQKMFSMDYKGSAFNALISGVPFTLTYADINVYFEPGTPEPALGTLATLFDVQAGGQTVYTNMDPLCQGAGCNPAACATQCDSGKPVLLGDHTHSYSYGNPFASGQELTNVTFYFDQSVIKLLPGATLHGNITMLAPTAEVTGKPILPTLGLPQGIKVGGKDTPYDQVTSGVGLTPTITWSAPSLGTPTHYGVLVIDLTDTTLGRNVASIYTASTSAEVPEGVMQMGRHYYIQVWASVKDGDDLAMPFHYSAHESTSTMFTGVVTP